MEFAMRPRAVAKSADEVREAASLWQAQTGLRLPQSYLDLMLQSDGGAIYPCLYRPGVPPAGLPGTAPLALLGSVYRWDMALRLFQGQDYGAGTPPQMWFLGGDGGGLEVLISLQPSSRGQVYAWRQSTAIWGSDGNDAGGLLRLADSLLDFLSMLVDSPEKDGLAHFGGDAAIATARRVHL